MPTPLSLPAAYGTDVRPALGNGARALWAKNASGPEANNGTRLDADWVNSMTGLVRGLFAAAGLTPLAGEDTAIANAVIALIGATPPAAHNHDARYYTESEVDTALDLKAPLASPALTGNPTTPNQSAGTNNTRIANTAYVDAAVAVLAAIVSGALVFKGAWDASSGAFPTTSGRKTGWFYKVSVAGTVDGVSFSVGDDLFAIVDDASGTTYANNWLKIEGNITLTEVVAALGFTPLDAAAVINNLTTNSSTSALSAAMGKSLKDTADALATNVAGKEPAQTHVSGPEIAAGAETNIRSWSPADVKASVDAHAPAASSSAGIYGVRGLVGGNNSGTPNTQLDIAADAVVLMNAGGATVRRMSTGTLTCDVTVAGPAANGRDQAGAFSADSWVHFYFIWSGTTLAALASATAPPAGPTLPSGYTHWAYIGGVYLDGSSQLRKVSVRGRTVWYLDQIEVVSGGSATSSTSVSLAAAVPPNAHDIFLHVSARHTDPSNTPWLYIDAVSSIGTFAIFRLGAPGSSGGLADVSGSLALPNVGQQFEYRFNVGATGREADIAVTGYSVPGG